MKQRILSRIRDARAVKKPGILPVVGQVRDERRAAAPESTAPESTAPESSAPKSSAPKSPANDGAAASGEPRAKTGPKTAAGRAVRLSAYKHGLAGQSLVVPREELPAYREFSQGFISRFKPADFVERQALQKIIDANWKGHVATAIEYNLLNSGAAQSDAGQTANEDLNTLLGKVDTWVNNSEEFERFGRYAVRWNRESDRLLREFRDLQAERRRLEQEQRDGQDAAARELPPHVMTAGAFGAASPALAASVPVDPLMASPVTSAAISSVIATPVSHHVSNATPDLEPVAAIVESLSTESAPAAESVRPAVAAFKQVVENRDCSAPSQLFSKVAENATTAPPVNSFDRRADLDHTVSSGSNIRFLDAVPSPWFSDKPERHD